MSVYFYSHYTIILEICSVVVILASSRCNVMKYTGSVYYLCIIHGTTCTQATDDHACDVHEPFV